MLEMKNRVLILYLAMFLVLLPPIDQAQASVWPPQPVDRYGDKGADNSLALDSAGRPHISYREFDWWKNTDYLKYASYDGIGWRTQYVDMSGDVGFASSLSIDSGDLPSIAYHDSSLNLKFAKFDGSAWRFTVIDKGANPSLALDALDRPHLSYVVPTYFNDAFHKLTDIKQSDLKYAFWDGQKWQTQTVEPGGRVGEDSSIAIDKNGRPHIAYRHTGVTAPALKYATWDGTAWRITVVDAAISNIFDPKQISQNISIAIDPSGHPCISYLGAGYSLKYASWDGTKWQFQTVKDQAGGYEVSNSLALDKAGRPHILYRDYVPDALKYAVWDGSGWQTDTIDSGDVPGLANSLKLDASDQPHVGYYAGINGEGGGALYYATIGAPRSVTATPTGGLFGDAIGVTLTTGNVLDAIYYTTDGSTPTRSSARYNQFYPVSISRNGTTRLKFFAVDGKGNESAVQTEVYVIDTTTPVYAVTINRSGSGSGTVAVDGAPLGAGFSQTSRYRSGTEITLTPLSDYGTVFGGWSGACSGTGTCRLSMDAAKSVTASFEALEAGAGFSALSAGAYHTLILNKGGGVDAWGLNGNGQLGDGTNTDRRVPTRVSAIAGIKAISAGGGHSLALKEDGTVMAWGWNGYGQVGDGSTTNRSVPTMVAGLSGVTAIAAGYGHSLALKSDGTVVAWGSNGNGQLGDGSTTSRTSPTPVYGLSGVTEIAAGTYHSMALKNDGTVVAWGYNGNGRLGDGSTVQRTSPVKVSGLSGVTAIAAGTHHSLALNSSGTVYGWGDNSYHQLGYWYLPQQATPIAIQGLSGITAIAAGGLHSVAVNDNGALLAWGDNTDGQLGQGNTTKFVAPVQVTGVGAVESLGAGMYHSVALQADGMALAWGLNSSGQLGDWTTTARTTPVQVKFTLAPFSVSVDGAIDNGAISCTGPVSYNKESVCSITPDPNYQLSSFSVNGVDRLAEVRGNSYTIGNVQQDQHVTGSFAASATLTLDLAGSGGGSVHGDLSCISGTACSPVAVRQGTVVNLMATPDANSLFGGWSGPCTVTGNNCALLMDGAKSITATFNAAPVVRILGGASYGTLSAAYSAAANDAVIQARAVFFEEGGLVAGRPVSVRLSGGYSADFSSCQGEAVLKGRLLIRNGTVRLNNVALR
jgi:alpha-tubulin suppressor-like RCC1 family protein